MMRKRPQVARYNSQLEGYDSELVRKYPLQLIMPHPRMTFHTHHDTHAKWLSEIPANRIYKEGYPWHTTGCIRGMLKPGASKPEISSSFIMIGLRSWVSLMLLKGCGPG